MAQIVSVVLEDDLTGGPAEQTIRFAFDGTDYEIDLNAKNAATFGKQLAPYCGRAGIIRSDEHVRFPSLPGDRHLPAGHPLPDLRPRSRLRPGSISEALTEHYRRAHPEALGIPAE